MKVGEPYKFDRVKKLVPPGKAYGVDSDYFRPLREGSNFEVPSFSPNEFAFQFPLATGKSKKLYERAVGTALVEAAMSPPDMGVVRRATKCSEQRAGAAFTRLQDLRYGTRRK